ncbi:MAG: S24/S26 family peptidase [Acidobacteria bacterium]|nr:S24/S26 family peptidase [Acidobacteriota bacterium]
MILPSRDFMPVVRAALERGQRVKMTVTGTSMWPFLRNEDVVELKPAGGLRLGDMVLVQAAPPDTSERYVLHRVVRMQGGGTFVLRGDAQPHCEGPFAPNAALGVVTTVWRHGRVHHLDRGLWRLAGIAWARTSPLGPLLLQLTRPLWQLRRKNHSGSDVPPEKAQSNRE